MPSLFESTKTSNARIDRAEEFQPTSQPCRWEARSIRSGPMSCWAALALNHATGFIASTAGLQVHLSTLPSDDAGDNAERFHETHLAIIKPVSAAAQRWN